MDAILARRTIRRYLPDAVPTEDVKEIIKAGMCAPSTGKEEPWHFIIVDDKELLGRIQEGYPYGNMIDKAPVSVLVCYDTKLEIHKGAAALDCAASVENMLIAATAKKLGSAWLGIYHDEKSTALFSSLFGLPENIVPFALVVLGHAAEEKYPKDKFDQARIKHNKW
jgi:nitroreductase